MRLWGNEYYPSLFVEVEIGAASLQDNLTTVADEIQNNF